MFELLKKKIWANVQRKNHRTFQQKIFKEALKNKKIGIRDPGFRIPDPGSKKHRIPNPDPQHW